MLKKWLLPLVALLGWAVLIPSCSKSDDIKFIEVESVAFSSSASSTFIGHSFKLSVIVNPSDANEPYTLVFESSDPAVASVDQKGEVKALKKGQAKISVCLKDRPQIRDEYDLTVTELYKAPENKKFQKVGYFPSYRNFTVSDMTDERLKMVDVACFAFASINDNYTLSVQEPAKLTALVARCRANGVKVLISLNGGHKLFAAMTSSPSARGTFIASLRNIVETYGLDGVDNDWEYPKASDGSGAGNTALMKELSAWLHDPTVNKLLTMAIAPGKYAASASGIERECYDYVDWFNIMVYDDFSTTVPGINHSPFALMQTAYDYWVVQKGLPGYKFVGGIPVYGRASGITQSGTTMGFGTILSKGGDPDKNEATVTSSTYNSGTTPYTIYYNGRPLVRQKTRFCIDNHLGGVMFWEAGQDCKDDRSLIKAAFDEVAGYSEIM